VIDFEKDSNGNVVSMVISSISDSESDIETGSDLSASRYAINDTGITVCSGDTDDVEIDRTTDDSYFGQDCDYGRDTNPFMNSDDNGHAGFNFVKISSAGVELSADATSWECVQDNITGLMWEVKTDDGGLRDKNWDYTWYNSDDDTNGGDGYEGTPNGGSCVDTVNCDTEKYVAKVNESSLCGFTDWRMPASNELRSLVHYGIDGPYSVDKPSIDEDYFDNTSGGNYWSSSPSADNSSNARRVGFVTGFYVDTVKTTASSVRLVRTGTD